MAQKTVIEGTDVTASQLKEFFSAIDTRRITRQSLQAFLERRNPFAETEASPATFLTADYFVTRPGLWVSDDFKSRITSAHPDPIVLRGLEGIESFDLGQDSLDTMIFARPEMGGEENVRKHAFTPDQIGGLIDLQPGGVPGRLLANGYANLFYVVGRGGTLFVVDVNWRADRRKWHVNAWLLDEGGRWDAGHRVFRNTQVFEA